jgi:hypothetical protein
METMYVKVKQSQVTVVQEAFRYSGVRMKLLKTAGWLNMTIIRQGESEVGHPAVQFNPAH